MIALRRSQGFVGQGPLKALSFDTNPFLSDFGLDAAYIRPRGEIWFSTEVDFTDQRFGHIGHGDLLSDTGRVVVRNLELVRRFTPVQDVASLPQQQRFFSDYRPSAGPFYIIVPILAQMVYNTSAFMERVRSICLRLENGDEVGLSTARFPPSGWRSWKEACRSISTFHRRTRRSCSAIYSSLSPKNASKVAAV